jgi:hypothetical protein
VSKIQMQRKVLDIPAIDDDEAHANDMGSI